MKIIKEKDQRYPKLTQLFERINRIDKYVYSEGGGIKYIIPKELVINKIDRWTGRGNHIYISDEEDSYVITYRLESLLWESTHLTKQEYFDIVFLNINDTRFRPRCYMCDSEMNFSNKIGQGYRSGGGTGENNDENIPYLCCSSCKSSYILYNRWEENYEEMRKSVENNGFRKIWAEDYYKMYDSIHNPVTEAYLCWSRFLSRATTEESFFYIIESNDLIKVGISCYLPYSRFQNAFLVFGNSKIKYRVYSGKTREIADLEYDIKLLLNDYTNNDVYGSEYFINQEGLFEMINKILKHYLKRVNFII